MKGRSILLMLLVISLLTSVFITQNVSISQKNNLTPLIDVEIPQEEIVDLSEGFKEYSTGIDCYRASLGVQKDKRNYDIATTGTVNAKTFGISVEQKIASKEIYYADGSFLCEDVTKSKSSLSESSAIETFFNSETNEVTVRETSTVSEELVATYNKGSKKYTTTEYTDKYGYLCNEDVYIVSPKTLKNEKNFLFDGETYSFTLVFKPNVATKNYKKRIKLMSGSSEEPKFTKCEQTLKIDKTGKILSVKTLEEYSLQMGLIEVNVKNEMISTYTYYENDLLA